MTRARTPVTVTIGWADPAVDVSAAVVSGRVSHGSGESNSERSVIAVARGTLTLQGADYQPGRSTRFTDAVLTRRAPIKVMLGSTLLWSGWCERPRAAPRALVPLTRFTLSGGLEAHSRARVDVASATTNVYTDATVWADVTGAVPRLTGASGAGITFAPFMFKGRGFEFASLAALVGGRLVGEDRQGRLTMPTYGRLPAAQTPITNVGHLIRAVETEQPVEQIRNRLRIPFDLAPATETVGVDLSVTLDAVGRASTHANQWQGLVEALEFPNYTQPLPTSPTTFGPMSVRVTGVTYHVPVTLSYPSDSVGNVRTGPMYLTYSDIAMPTSIVGTIALSSNTVNGREVASLSGSWVDVDDLAVSYDYTILRRGRDTRPQDRNRTLRNPTEQPFFAPSTDTTFGGLGQSTYDLPSSTPVFLFNAAGVVPHWITVNYRIEWTASTPQTGEQAVNNTPSQGEWGIREVVWPVWVTGTGNTTRIEADLADIAQPRTYHDVTMPLWQPDTARSAEVAALDYGDYVDLGIRDDRQGVNIADKCVITERTLDWGAEVVPAVRLRCLHTGEAGTAPVTARALRIGTTPLRIGATPLRLEIA